MKPKTIEVQPVTLIPTPMGTAMFLSDGDKVILMYIDPSIGASMNDVLRGETPERPQSHDFFYNFMEGLGVKLVGCYIVKEEEEVFYAQAVFKMENEVKEKKILQLDGRPSDCISLAVRFNQPIRFVEDVWERQPDMSELLENLKQQIDNADD